MDSGFQSLQEFLGINPDTVIKFSMQKDEVQAVPVIDGKEGKSLSGKIVGYLIKKNSMSDAGDFVQYLAENNKQCRLGDIEKFFDDELKIYGVQALESLGGNGSAEKKDKKLIATALVGVIAAASGTADVRENIAAQTSDVGSDAPPGVAFSQARPPVNMESIVVSKRKSPERSPLSHIEAISEKRKPGEEVVALR